MSKKNPFLDTMATVYQQSEPHLHALLVVQKALAQLQDSIQDTWPNVRGLEIHSSHGLVLLCRGSSKVPLFRVTIRPGKDIFGLSYLGDDGLAIGFECPTYIAEDALGLEKMIHGAMVSSRVIQRIAKLMVDGLDLTTKLA